jgi:hypothetical protein
MGVELAGDIAGDAGAFDGSRTSGKAREEMTERAYVR